MEKKQAASRGPGLTPKPQSSIYPHSHSRAAGPSSRPLGSRKRTPSPRGPLKVCIQKGLGVSSP